MGNWITAALMGLLGLVGLFLASRAVDGTFYGFGLLLFVFSVLFIFTIIHRQSEGSQDT